VGVGLWLLTSARVASSSDRESAPALSGAAECAPWTGASAPAADGLSIGVLRTPGARFDASGVGLHDFGLAVRGFGRESGVDLLSDKRPRLRDGRIEYDRGALRECYASDGAGLLQAFVVAAPPAGAGRIVVAADVRGDFAGRVLAGARDAEFRHADGRRASYTGLVAWDADGRDLDARLALEGRELRIEVDDTGARYPLVIDPLLVVEEQKLTPADGVSNDRFGFSVSVDGDTLAVGANAVTQGGLGFAGAVYVFVREGNDFVLQQKLSPPLPAAGGNFGNSVDVKANTLLVGAPGTLGTGGAFVFVRVDDVWSAQALLRGANAQSGDREGASVALSDGVALVGAPNERVNNMAQTGAAYVFRRNGTMWPQEARLTAADGENGDHFGSAVALSGDRAAIGAPDADDQGNRSGNTYVFARDGGVWTQQQKLQASNGAADFVFGTAVALTTQLVVGAPGAAGLVAGSGAAYSFAPANGLFVQEQIVSASDGELGDRFGTSFALRGSSLAVGAPGENTNQGVAYLFTRAGAGWVETARLEPGDRAPTAFFGQSLAYSGSRIVVGAPTDGAGAVHVFGTRRAGSRAAGSLLLFPEFDNRHGIATVVTVTNTDRGEYIDAHFKYVARRGPGSQWLDCEVFDRSELLTPNDTVTLLTNYHNPQHEQGYLFVYAREQESRDPNFREPIGFDRLIGNLLVVDGLDAFEYSVNAASYRAGVRHRERTDLDWDAIRDLDGREYEAAPDEVLVPRFIGQGGRVEGELVLIGLSGGSEYTTTADFLVYNDDEQVFSRQYTFRCWEKVLLEDVGLVFTHDFLAHFSGDDPYESLGYMEYGWYRITGGTASAGASTIQDAVVYAVHIEIIDDTAAADLPFEQGERDGHLLPNALSGDNSESPNGCGP
jgi:hypothetical protein